MNTKYFLLYDDHNYLKFIDEKPTFYKDISEIDLETINYSKEEFLKKYNLTNNNYLIIAKIALNKDKKYYNVTLYNPLFQTKNKMHENRLNQIKKTMLNRLDKVVNKKREKLLDDTPSYRSLLKSIFDEILADKKMKFYLTIDDNNKKVNLKVKEKILEMDKNYNFSFNQADDILKSYMEFRNLLLEFLNYYRQDLKQDLFVAENYIFPSEVFDYQISFYINPYDASNDIDKKIDEELIDKEFVDFQKLIQIKNSPFDDEEIGRMYKIDGLPGVMKHFDGNHIYSSTKEDLLRLGIISDEEYLKKEKELKP